MDVSAPNAAPAFVPPPETWQSRCLEAFPEARLLGWLRSVAPPAFTLTEDQLRPAVEAVRAGERVVLIVSDHTRKTGLADVLPLLWAGWQTRGVRREDLTILVACGSHRAPTLAEQESILGPLVWPQLRDRVQVHDAFASPCARIGVTSRGTHVEMSETVVNADAVVTCGGVTFHYFAGFTGGRKSILPGVASARTIAANHSLTIDRARRRLDPAVQIGELAGNPVAEDMAEGAALVRVRASVQTVLTAAGRLAGVFAGEMGWAHARACELARLLFACPVSTPADLVVGWAGPARNWLQSHKALVNVSRALDVGGVAVLLAECPEGLGSASLAHWLSRGSPEAILEGIAESADINAQTALSTMVRGRGLILVTRLPPEVLAQMHVPGTTSLAAALHLAKPRLDRHGVTAPRLLLMPEAWLTVPVLPPGHLSPE